MSNELSQSEINAIVAAKLRRMQPQSPQQPPKQLPKQPQPVQSQQPENPKPKDPTNPYSDRQKYRHKTLGYEAYFADTPWGMDGITVQVFIPEEDHTTVLPLRMLETETPTGWVAAEVKS